MIDPFYGVDKGLLATLKRERQRAEENGRRADHFEAALERVKRVLDSDDEMTGLDDVRKALEGREGES